MATFSCLRFLDLHGNANKKERGPDGSEDKNVFDIRQGVAICLATRGTGGTGVDHSEIWGERERKYSWLGSSDLVESSYSALTPNGPFYFFEPRNTDFHQEYEQGWRLVTRCRFTLPDLLRRVTTSSSMLTTKNFWHESQSFPICRSLIRRYVRHISLVAVRASIPMETLEAGSSPKARRRIGNDEQWQHRVRECTYRPFDNRYVYWTNWMVDWPRSSIQAAHAGREECGLSTTRSTEVVGGWEHIFASKHLIQHHTVSLKEVNYLFPLYTYLPRPWPTFQVQGNRISTVNS